MITNIFSTLLRQEALGTYQESLICIPNPFPLLKFSELFGTYFSSHSKYNPAANSDSEITMPSTLQNDFSLYKMNARPYQSDKVEQHQMILPLALSCSMLQVSKGITVAA